MTGNGPVPIKFGPKSTDPQQEGRAVSVSRASCLMVELVQSQHIKITANKTIGKLHCLMEKKLGLYRAVSTKTEKKRCKINKRNNLQREKTAHYCTCQ